jgi:hypothetical protein
MKSEVSNWQCEVSEGVVEIADKNNIKDGLSQLQNFFVNSHKFQPCSLRDHHN